MKSLGKYSVKVFCCLMLLFVCVGTVHANNSNPPESEQGQNKHSVLTFKHNKFTKEIIFSTFNSDFSVLIFDKEGITVKEVVIHKNKKHTISIEDLKPGEYFVRYIGDSVNNNSEKKIVIE